MQRNVRASCLLPSCEVFVRVGLPAFVACAFEVLNESTDEERHARTRRLPISEDVLLYVTRALGNLLLWATSTVTPITPRKNTMNQLDAPDEFEADNAVAHHDAGAGWCVEALRDATDAARRRAEFEVYPRSYWFSLAMEDMNSQLL
eukprot:GHVT01011853.1.p1 GENE.GHVT01011853.1~~GHVT01011853.1.p1  ORF type:complete len:147 (+),score=9.96 GHVT01011853.1:54-494(+)